MTNFVKLQKTVYDLLNKYGTTFVHTKVANGEYDPTTGTLASNPASQTLNGLPEEYSDSVRMLGVRLEPSNPVLSNDKKLLAPNYNLAFAYEVGDTVTQLGETYTIVGIAKAVAVNVIVYYVLHLRG